MRCIPLRAEKHVLFSGENEIILKYQFAAVVVNFMLGYLKSFISQQHQCHQFPWQPKNLFILYTLSKMFSNDALKLS